MKQQYKWILILGLAVAVSSCLGDNYEQPDAAVFGTVTDATTGERIPQDIGDQGSRINLWELSEAYPNPDRRNLLFKTDGSYRNNNFFSGHYKVKFNETNFNPATVTLKGPSGDIPVVQDYDQEGNEIGLKAEFDVNGPTQLDFTAEPWCRITVKEIVFDEAKQRVVAQFEVECTSNDKLKEIGIFCDRSPHVSYSINGWGDADVKSKKIDRVLSQPELFTLKMPLTMFEKKDSDKDYWIRVGAHSAAEDARWNFAPAVKLYLSKKEIPSRKLGMRWDLFDGCDDEGNQDAEKFAVYKAMWEGGVHRSLPLFYYDNKDYKTGKGAWVAVSDKQADNEEYHYTTFISPGEGKGGIVPEFDISAIPMEGCHMILGMYVSDATHFERDAHGQIEIGSAKVFDQEELCWIFGQFELRNGWQNLDLSLAEGNAGGGTFRPKHLNWFRVYHQHEKIGNTTLKFDEIRFYYKTIIESCESTDGWHSPRPLVLDEADVKEGEGAVVTTNAANRLELWKGWGRIIVPASLAKGHFQFWLNVSDAAKLNASTTTVSYSSSGGANDAALSWTLPTNLQDGWNLVDLKMSDAEMAGTIDLKNTNYFRIYSNVAAEEGSVTIKVDRLRFYNEDVDVALMDVLPD